MGFESHQKLRKDRALNIKYPDCPEYLTGKKYGMPEEDDDYEEQRTTVLPGALSQPVVNHLATSGKPPVTSGKPPVTGPLLVVGVSEVKVSEVKVSKEKISEGNTTGKQESSQDCFVKQAQGIGDWSNFRKIHRRFFSKKPVVLQS
jgi:hypothetical protein